MKKFFLIDRKIPVTKETFSGGVQVVILSLFGWTFYTPAYDMVEFGHCRNEEFSTCEEVDEAQFTEAVAARIQAFADRGHKVSF